MKNPSVIPLDDFDHNDTHAKRGVATTAFSDVVAKQLEERGLVSMDPKAGGWMTNREARAVEGKTKAAGEVQQSSVSRAARALAETIAKPSGRQSRAAAAPVETVETPTPKKAKGRK